MSAWPPSAVPLTRPGSRSIRADMRELCRVVGHRFAHYRPFSWTQTSTRRGLRRWHVDPSLLQAAESAFANLNNADLETFNDPTFPQPMVGRGHCLKAEPRTERKTSPAKASSRRR